jgi:hypothetical protein
VSANKARRDDRDGKPETAAVTEEVAQ